MRRLAMMPPHATVRPLRALRAAGRALLAAALAAGSLGAAAQADAPPGALAECAALSDDALRLACYDRLAGRAAPLVPAVPAGRTPDLPLPPPAPAGSGLAGPPAPRPSFLSRYWELDDADKRGTFNFTGYRPNFLLPVHVGTDINKTPFSPTRGAGMLEPADYQRVEAKLQLSLRTKLAQNLLLPGADLWFGYTQQSQWQLYNRGLSAPFRNTDYEPELMYMVPVPGGLRQLAGGWQWRYGVVALAHQSNGQAQPLSRSWNRVYFGAGLERDSLSLSLRLNRRLSEDLSSDDNPDLTAYRGRADLLAAWTPGRATAALQWRNNLKDFKHGSLQFDWTYPVEPDSARALRWYLQFFTGYAETLLDYNFRQTSLGLGLTLFEF